MYIKWWSWLELTANGQVQNTKTLKLNYSSLRDKAIVAKWRELMQNFFDYNAKVCHYYVPGNVVSTNTGIRSAKYKTGSPLCLAMWEEMHMRGQMKLPSELRLTLESSCSCKSAVYGVRFCSVGNSYLHNLVMQSMRKTTSELVF